MWSVYSQSSGSSVLSQDLSHVFVLLQPKNTGSSKKGIHNDSVCITASAFAEHLESTNVVCLVISYREVSYHPLCLGHQRNFSRELEKQNMA